MSTVDFSRASAALCDEPEREVSHDAPLLLPLIEQAAGEPQARKRLFEVVSQLTQRAAQHLPIAVASPLCHTSQTGEEQPFANQVFTTVSECLQQGFRRLLLVPWGGRQGMGPLVESALLALSTVTGEAVSQVELPLPHVHVEGVSARSALGGLSSIQTQLSPLLAAFPEWDRRWTRLSGGKATILVLRSGKVAEQPSATTATWEEPTLKALTVAMGLQHAGVMTANGRSHWQRDGEIYARYLVSLLGAATDLLQQE